MPTADCGPWRAVAARDVASGSQALEGAMNMKHHPVNFEKTLLHMHEFSIFVLPHTL